MKARDAITSTVVSVDADTPTGEIARRLLEHHISAVPVLDKSGAPIGMVSEGDLIGRNDREREARRDRWLSVLAEGEALSRSRRAFISPRACSTFPAGSRAMSGSFSAGASRAAVNIP